MNNPAVNADLVLEPHARETAKRATDYEEVLVVHDTTEVKPRCGASADDLGELRPGTPGFFFHSSLVVAPGAAHTALGVVAAQRWTRTGPPRAKGRKNRLTGAEYAKIPVQERESYRWWKGAEVASEALTCDRIHVADREADTYWLLCKLIEEEERFVIRSAQDRSLVEGGRLRSKLRSLEPEHEIAIEVSRRKSSSAPRSQKIHGDRNARKTTVHVAGAAVEIKRPQKSKHETKSLKINALRIWESASPADGSKQIEWVLLTTEPVSCAEELEQVIDFYRSRWVVEEFFKALKTGCALEKRQFESYHALQNVLALLIPIAWRLLLLRSLERLSPDSLAETAVRTSLVDVLRQFSSYKLPADPTVRDVLLSVAALGGHQKNNGPPGWQILGRGYERLLTLEAGFLAGRATSAS